MVENNHRFFLPISLNRIHGRPIHRVAAWWVAAVRPVDRSVGEVEFEVDRFRQILVKKFDVFAVRWSLVLGNLETGAKDTSLAGIVRTFLSPIEFSTFDVERDSHTPFLYLLPR